LLGEVRIFNGEGKLLRTVNPKFNYKSIGIVTVAEHPCPRKECGKLTTRKKYCSPECSTLMKALYSQRKRIIESRESAHRKAMKPTRKCAQCGNLTQRPKFCYKSCANLWNREKAKAGAAIYKLKRNAGVV
jgi:hypothetical protein